MSLFLAVGAMAQIKTQIAGVKNIPATRVDLSQGLQTGYYLLKQVNNNASAAGGQGVGYIKAANEAVGASATSKNTDEPQLNGVTYVWYVEVVNAESNLITISTANKVAAWQAPTQREKPLVAYANKATLKYHTGTVNLSGNATPNAGSCFISNEGTTAFVHFSGDVLGSWDDTNQASMFMVEFYKLDDEDLNILIDYTPNHTGAKSNTTRKIGSFSVNDDTYTLTANEQAQKFVDKTSKVFAVGAGSVVEVELVQSAGSWMNAFVYIDADKNGFTAGIENDYLPTGDLVSYSFYNNGASSDESGWNSNGSVITGGNRSTVALPSFTAPTMPGTYRMRVKYDWCNIDPDGVTGRYFSNDFAGHGAAIIDFTIEVLPSYTLNVTDAGWATLYLDFNAAIPADVDAYTVTEIKNGCATLTEVEGVLPANTGVLVNAAQGSYTFNYAAEATANVEGNLLEGTAAATEIETEAYVLSIVNGNVGLYKAQMAGGVWLNNANKAYLPASAVPAANNAASFSFRFEGGTTGVEEVKTENGEVKTIYDLTGRQVNAVERGIYIINGKKVLVK